jgi:hypothetical protein
MKISGLLLFTSLAANTALFAVFAFKSSSAFDAMARTTRAAQAEVHGSSATKTSDSAGAADTTSTADLPATTWSTLQNSDLSTLVARLRAAGFPPYVIRRIVSDRLEQSMIKRYNGVLKQQFDRPFWKDSSSAFLDPKTMATMRAAGKEYSDTLKSLLGEDPDADSLTSVSQKRRYGDLPKAKLEQLQTIESDYSELTMQVQYTARGLMLPEDQEKLALLEKEKNADMAKLLTPQELEDYNLRSSASASQLRSNLTTFNPTEAEFRALYKLQSGLDDQYPQPMGITTAEQRAPREAAEKQLQPQIQALLGPDRYADYQLATDPKYSSINRLVARLELPSSTSVAVVNVQETAQKQAMALRQDSTLSPDQRNAQMATLAQQAQAQLTAALGPSGFEAYKDYGGYWLQNLQARPGPTITTKPAIPVTP